MKILVTGAAGFIGSHLTEKLLDQGFEVVGVDNLSSFYAERIKERNLMPLLDKGLQFIKGDLATVHTLLSNDFHYIFHLAAQPGLDERRTLNDYVHNNIVATQRLIDVAQRCAALRLFVNISASSVYGKNASQSEQAVLRPVSWYGITKCAAEQLVLAQHYAGLFPACSLRLYSVYGPRERPDKLYSKLIHCGLNGLAFPLFEGSLAHSRSFSYVDDIVDGLLSVIGREAEIKGEVINLGNTQTYSTAEGIALLESILKRKIQLETVPSRPGDQLQTTAIIDKARKLLGFNPKTTLFEGLAKQVAWAENTLENT